MIVRDPPAHSAPPFRPAQTVGPEEARCRNCWAFERPAAPMTIQGIDQSGLSKGDLSLLGIYLSEAGFCTLNPPTTGPRKVGLQPITHPSNRCASFLHLALAQARMAGMAAGKDPDGDPAAPPQAG